jgi:uncharacterized membrane protein YvbJ
MFCKKCGAEIADDSEFCSKCGQSVNDGNVQKQETNPSQLTTVDKVQSGVQGITLIVAIIMIVVAVSALIGTCS